MCACVRAQSWPTLCDSMDCGMPGSSVHGILQARILEWWPCPPPGDLPDSGIEPASPVSPALQADSLPSKPSGKSLKCRWCNNNHFSKPVKEAGFTCSLCDSRPHSHVNSFRSVSASQRSTLTVYYCTSDTIII